MIELSRRKATQLFFVGAASFMMPQLSSGSAWAQGSSGNGVDYRHAFSPLGEVAHDPAFAHFVHRKADAPKGGQLRLGRVGAFDTYDTLRYPGRPPADMRVIYDRLVIASPDEPASFYGHLAEGVAVSDDLARLSFRLSDEAIWHDGVPITSADVVYTFETLKSAGAPFYRQAYRAVSIVAEDERQFHFINEGRPNRDLIGSLASLPIHPAHRADPPGPDNLPLGSGPYRIVEGDAPSRIVLGRVADYWAGDAATVRGAYNFDRLAIRYYRDADVAFEAFRAGEYDVRIETNPARWRAGYEGLAINGKPIGRATAPAEGPGRLHGLVMNTRRGPLADRRVRQALHLAYDAQNVIERLFAGVFQPVESVFEGMDFAASGVDPLQGMPARGSREATRLASQLLDEAGYLLDGTRRIDPDSGEPIEFSAVSTNPLYDGALGEVRLAFERIGMRLVPQVLEPSIASRQLLDRQFDIATLAWAPAKLPGSAERLLWHSALADRPGSYALSGLRDSALDESLEAMTAARTLEEAVQAGRSFDQLLRASFAFLPLWRDGEIRLAWKTGLQAVDRPEFGRSANFIADWWQEDV